MGIIGGPRRLLYGSCKEPRITPKGKGAAIARNRSIPGRERCWMKPTGGWRTKDADVLYTSLSRHDQAPPGVQPVGAGHRHCDHRIDRGDCRPANQLEFRVQYGVGAARGPRRDAQGH